MMRCLALVLVVVAAGCWTSSSRRESEWPSNNTNQALSNRAETTGCARSAVIGTWHVSATPPDGWITFTLELMPDGKTGHRHYTHEDGRKEGDELNLAEQDRWTLVGNTIEFDFNSKYVHYTGTCPSGGVMTGDAVNVHDTRWTWKAERRP